MWQEFDRTHPQILLLKYLTPWRTPLLVTLPRSIRAVNWSNGSTCCRDIEQNCQTLSRIIDVGLTQRRLLHGDASHTQHYEQSKQRNIAKNFKNIDKN